MGRRLLEKLAMERAQKSAEVLVRDILQGVFKQSTNPRQVAAIAKRIVKTLDRELTTARYVLDTNSTPLSPEQPAPHQSGETKS